MTSVDQQRLRDDALYYQTYDTAGNKVTWKSVKQDAIARAKKYFELGDANGRSDWQIEQDIKNICLSGSIPRGDKMFELIKSDMSQERESLHCSIEGAIVEELLWMTSREIRKLKKEYKESKK